MIQFNNLKTIIVLSIVIIIVVMAMLTFVGYRKGYKTGLDIQVNISDKYNQQNTQNKQLQNDIPTNETDYQLDTYDTQLLQKYQYLNTEE